MNVKNPERIVKTPETLKIVVVTNRRLCRGDFFERLEQLAEARPDAVILREKDLSESEYRTLARRALSIFARRGVRCILHHRVDVAKELQCPAIHLPLAEFLAIPKEDRKFFETIGVSCHSPEEARQAAARGADVVVAGHVFDTACKSGTPGRGLAFLRDVVQSVAAPVFAIGGVSPANVEAIRAVGATGVCVMSGAMQCDDVAALVGALRATDKG